MRTRLLHRVLLTVAVIVGLTPVAMGQAVIFSETFDKCEGTGGNDGQWGGGIASAQIAADNDGWSFSKGYGAKQCVRLGTGSAAGAATSPALAKLSGTATLTFKAAAWQGDGTTLRLTVQGGRATPSEVTMKRGEWTTYKIAITGNSSSKISFQASGTSRSRFFLDDVKVESGEAIDDGRKNVEGLAAFAALPDGTEARLYIPDASMARVVAVDGDNAVLRDESGASVGLYGFKKNPSMQVQQHVAGYIMGRKSTSNGMAVLLPASGTSTYLLGIALPVTEPTVDVGGIAGVRADDIAGEGRTYDLLGRDEGRGRTNLPLGIHVRNGRKIIVK